VTRLHYVPVLIINEATALFPSKRNRLRCVRCVWMETGQNASDCVGKQPIMVATASTEHPAANRMLGRSSGNHDWLLANAIACVLPGFHPNARNATDCVWMETGLNYDRQFRSWCCCAERRRMRS